MPRPSDPSTEAKPKPWNSPNTNAIAASFTRATGHRLCRAAMVIESAITDSTTRDGTSTTPSAASDSVIVCAIVKHETIVRILISARPKLSAG